MCGHHEPKETEASLFPHRRGVEGAGSSVGWMQLLLGGHGDSTASELGALPACLLTPAFCPRAPHSLTPVPEKGLVPKTAALGQVRLQPLQAGGKEYGLLARSVGTRFTFVTRVSYRHLPSVDETGLT